MVKTLQNKKGKQSNSLVMLSIKYLEVEPIMGILQELSIRVNKGGCPFSEEMLDDIWDVPH